MGLNLRRRTMMPPAEDGNLVLSLPLAYNGDLTEVVSGSNSWNNTQNFVWDAAENAYLFTGKYNSNAAYITGLNLPVTTVHNLNWTLEFDIKPIDYRVYIACMTLYNGNACAAAQYLYGNIGNGGYAPVNQWSHIKIIRYGGGNFDYYTNDVFIYSATQGDVNLSTNKFAVLGTPWSSSGVDSKAYIKNIKITLN